MSAGSSGARRVSRVINSISRDTNICRQCRHTYQRGYASFSAAAAQPEEPSSQLSDPIPAAASTQPIYAINAGVLVSRAPQITRDLHPFEKAFHFYQRRLNERLALPFTQYFYFRRGTPSDTHWKAKRKERGGVAARDIGKYNAYSKEAWNDELVVGDHTSDPDEQVQALLNDDGKADILGGINSRVTEADQKNDQRSLNRMLSRTLYLLVKGKEGYWSLPSTRVHGRENLKEAAQRTLTQGCGVNMNTWMVGNHPVGHYIHNYKDSKPDPSATETPLAGEKTFFMKCRIMAGQADLTKNLLLLDDFKWLAKEEIEKTVSPRYWSYVRNMLAEQ